MKIIGPATEDEMILAFVQAEYQSPVHRHKYEALGLNAAYTWEELMMHADLKDQTQNALRKHLLTNTRGYEKRSHLFAGFPDDVTWERVALSPDEIATLKHLNDDGVVARAPLTRRVGESAANFGKVYHHEGMAKITTDIKKGVKYPELIVVEVGSDLVLLEGNTRATAYRVSGDKEYKNCLLGRSPNMKQWAFA